MTDLYQASTPAQSDPRLIKLKDYLIKAVSTEMQDQSSLHAPDRERVRQLLVSALERTKAELQPEIRDRVLEAAVADLVGYGLLNCCLAIPRSVRSWSMGQSRSL